VKPATVIASSLSLEGAVQLPIAAWDKLLNSLFALDHDRQGRSLNAAHRRQMKAARFRIERCHGAGAIDSDQPICFRTADGRIRQRSHRLIVSERGETVANRVWSHRLQPKPLNRLF